MHCHADMWSDVHRRLAIVPCISLLLLLLCGALCDVDLNAFFGRWLQWLGPWGKWSLDLRSPRLWFINSALVWVRQGWNWLCIFTAAENTHANKRGWCCGQNNNAKEHCMAICLPSMMNYTSERQATTATSFLNSRVVIEGICVGDIFLITLAVFLCWHKIFSCLKIDITLTKRGNLSLLYVYSGW